jgi:hypothetical protein
MPIGWRYFLGFHETTRNECHPGGWYKARLRGKTAGAQLTGSRRKCRVSQGIFILRIA